MKKLFIVAIAIFTMSTTVMAQKEGGKRQQMTLAQQMDRRVEMMKKSLSLTDEQVAELKKANEAYLAELKKILGDEKYAEYEKNSMKMIGGPRGPRGQRGGGFPQGGPQGAPQDFPQGGFNSQD